MSDKNKNIQNKKHFSKEFKMIEIEMLKKKYEMIIFIFTF